MDRQRELIDLVNESLNRAEADWEGVATLLEAKEAVALANSRDFIPSTIPGHPLVDTTEPKVDEFIAFVLDIRDSTQRLMCAISEDKAKVSGLQRLFFETSALLPAASQLVEWKGGAVTEYLGDGLLAMFRVNEGQRAERINDAYAAATRSLELVQELVNPILNYRYGVPALSIGVGLALSKAIVTVVGLGVSRQAKAFGECVWRASKLSGGRNQVIVDESIRLAWPTSKGGRLHFRPTKLKGSDGFVVYQQ
jgi:class 3 adenylate cyclase